MSIETNSCRACVENVVGYWEDKRASAAKEQRRYEIARDVYTAIISNPCLTDSPTDSIRKSAPWAVELADALLAALEEPK